jgi:AbrB family looped-hinge helix DNA binding protein
VELRLELPEFDAADEAFVTDSVAEIFPVRPQTVTTAFPPSTVTRYTLTSKTVQRRGSMSKLATTKMSSKGQVVIPEDIRSRLGLEPGEQFIVVGDKDVVILKKIAPPSMRDFDSLVALARKQARVAGMKLSDVVFAVGKVRN